MAFITTNTTNTNMLLIRGMSYMSGIRGIRGSIPRMSTPIVGMAGGRRSSARAISRSQRMKDVFSDNEDDGDDVRALGGSLPAYHNNFYNTKSIDMHPKRADVMKPRNPSQVEYARLLQSPSPAIVIASGAAGTGKTCMAVSMAVSKLMENEYQKIVISRPAVCVEEEHGFLPGDLTMKMAPWLQPLYDTFYKYYTPEQVDAMIAKKIIDICPIAFLRGRTFSNSFIIIDEAQNCTANQMLMILTRIGQHSKMVITGDPMQSDRSVDQNGLTDLLRRLESKDLLGIKTVKFTEEDVERHPVIKDILRMYA